jgi:COP9 signalosome complex subunit 1
MLDMYVSPNVADLVQEIRHRAIIQFFNPYLSVKMTQMARTFNTTPAILENEIRGLILSGKLQARIDSHQMVWPTYTQNTISIVLIGQIMDRLIHMNI